MSPFQDTDGRLTDVAVAVAAIRAHLDRGDLEDGLVLDAVRMRLIEIGEAVKALPAELLAGEPNVPWRTVARMRDRLVHVTPTPRSRSCGRRSRTTWARSCSP